VAYTFCVMKKFESPDTVEVQARMPAGAMLQANEEFREQTGQLLFGNSLAGGEDYVWGRIDKQHIETVCAAIEKHGGEIRNAAITLAFPSQESVGGKMRTAA
jgi:hypothetical protein